MSLKKEAEGEGEAKWKTWPIMHGELWSWHSVSKGERAGCLYAMSTRRAVPGQAGTLCSLRQLPSDIPNIWVIKSSLKVLGGLTAVATTTGKHLLLLPLSSCWVVSDLASFAASWSVACQAPLSFGYPKQEYWSGLPFPSPGDLINPGTEPGSPTLAGIFFPTEPPGKPCESTGCYSYQLTQVPIH